MLETFTLIFIAYVLVSIFLMWDIHRTARCRWCDHCRMQEQKEKEKQELARHYNYHHFAGGSVSKCNDPKCKGR
jgi:hypothetical protein